MNGRRVRDCGWNSPRSPGTLPPSPAPCRNPGANKPYFPLIFSFNFPEHLKVTTWRGPSIKSSPVAGFRPLRSFLHFTQNLPNPETNTSQDLDHDDFYPTEAVKELLEDVKAYMKSRPDRFAVLSGSVGVGKTTLIQMLMEAFKASNEFTIAFMAHNDASKIKESMITNKLLRMIGEPPKRTADQETRYEILQDKLKERPRMLLVIDDAHKLKSDTLIELKKTNEKGVSILLAAHTQLARKLKLAMYEEIGLRAETFEVPGIVGEGRGYLEFLLEKSGGYIDQFSEEAVDELSRLCSTCPSQKLKRGKFIEIHHHLCIDWMRLSGVRFI